MIHHKVAQNSEEWLRLRLGIPTSSEFKKIVTPKGKLSTSSESYLNWLIAEWIVGHPLESPDTQWMTRGHEMEPFAVQSYEFETSRTAEDGGFITTDDGLVGCSPDRLIGSDGLLEIKSPSPQVHVGYMRNREVDEEYKPQCQGQLMVAEREWLDIQSYCPGFPTIIVRVARDEEYIKKLRTALTDFVTLMIASRVDLEQRFGPFERIKPKPAPDGDFDVSEGDVLAMIERGIVIPQEKQ